MKLLLQLTASTMVAAVGALELPSLSALRGALGAGVGSTCEDGYNDGRNSAWRIWNDQLSANCYNVWDLERLTEELIDEMYSDNSDWQQESFNTCAINAVHDEVERIEQLCLENDSSQCIELGNTAAELVVQSNWCTPGYFTPFTIGPDYKANCKEAATSICEGQIPNVASRWCPGQTMSTSQMLDLQDRCEEQVDSMVPGEAIAAAVDARLSLPSFLGEGKHDQGGQPDYCYPKSEDPDYECFKSGYPKCCSKNKGNCPNNHRPECECTPGVCDNNKDSWGEACFVGDGTCKGSTYCKSAEVLCGAGYCMEMTTQCAMDYSPVCGCDGENYANRCEAASVGVSVYTAGECEGAQEQ